MAQASITRHLVEKEVVQTPGVVGESPQDIRDDHKGEGDTEEKPKVRKPRKKKEVPQEAPLDAKQIEKMVCFPFNFVFGHSNLPLLTEEESATLAEACAPMFAKYGGWFSAWAPEVYCCMVILAVVEPRWRISQEMGKRKKAAAAEAASAPTVDVTETPGAREPLIPEPPKPPEHSGGPVFQSPLGVEHDKM